MWSVLVVAAVMSAPPALAVDGRVLNGYRFVTSALVRDPFITTHGQRDQWPVGLSFGIANAYTSGQGRDRKASTLHAGVGIYYTGRDALKLGVESSYLRIPGREGSDHLNTSSFAVSFQYYF